MKQTTLTRPSIGIKILYALGQFGWSLAIFGVGNLLPYFYMPPEDGKEVLFPAFIYAGPILMIATIIGLIGAGGRIIDAFTDPLIANWSDRATFKFGRRRTFMAIGFIPCAIFSFLVFYPLTPFESNLNAYWLTFCITLFYIFLTIYLIPYTAWISELGHTNKDRLQISTLISVTYALGLGLGTQVFALQSFFENTYNMDSTQAFQWILGGFAALSAVLMALPLFINEEKYCLQNKSELASFDAVKTVFKNRNFRFFALSDLMYWLSMTFIITGLSYYLTVLLQLDKSYVSLLEIGLLGLSFLFYPVVNYIANRKGKKILVTAGFIQFSILFGLVFFLGKFPFSPIVQASMLLLFSIFAVAIFGILPNVIVADIADEDAKRTQQHNVGMFYAARGFTMKIGISIATFLFPTLLLMGKSVENDMGIRATGVAAMIFCILGLILFQFYEEKPVEE